MGGFGEPGSLKQDLANQEGLEELVDRLVQLGVQVIDQGFRNLKPDLVPFVQGQVLGNRAAARG